MSRIVLMYITKIPGLLNSVNQTPEAFQVTSPFQSEVANRKLEKRLAVAASGTDPRPERWWGR